MAQVANKFSIRFATKVHRLKQMLKPVMKLMNKKSRSRIQAAVPSSNVEDATSENDQNLANEALECRLRNDVTERAARGAKGAIGVWVDGRVRLVPVLQTHLQIPVHFVSTTTGDFCWAPLPADSDICADNNMQTTGQTAQEQVPSTKFE